MRRSSLFKYLILVFLHVVPLVAQPATCPAIVQTALAATDTACADTGRNQACYGNVLLSAEPQSGAADFTFTAPGDLIAIDGIAKLTLSPMNQQKEEWGVAVMKLQANLPDTLPGQNLGFLLFGSVEIWNAAQDEQQLIPFNAFYFKTGLNDALCEQAPDSGILIQTPQGTGKITFTANNAEIELGSTAYFQAQPGGDMTITVIEGQAQVTAAGTAVNVPAGTRVRIPLDDNNNANGAPVGPEPYVIADLAALPVTHLERTVTVAPALSSDEITAFLENSIEVTPDGSVADGSGNAPLTSGTWHIKQTEISGSQTCAPDGENTAAYTFFSQQNGETLVMQYGNRPEGALTFERIAPDTYYNRQEFPGTYSDNTITIISSDRFTLDQINGSKTCHFRIEYTLVRAE